jgi:PAP2 superfamily
MGVSADQMKWATIVIIAIFDFLLSHHLGISVVVHPWVFVFIAILAGVSIIYPMLRPDPRFAELCKSTAQFFGFLWAVIIASCLVAALKYPLIDSTLDRMDAALGLHWMFLFNFVQSRPWLDALLTYGYWTSAVQIPPICIILNAIGRHDRVDELVSVFMANLTIVVSISAILPAAGAWVYYDVVPLVNAYYLPLFEGLRDGSIREIALTNITGIVQFPSFHVAMGILFTYAVRGIRFLFPIVTIMNVLLIAGTPTVGGHYFIDVIVGAALTLTLIMILRSYGARLQIQRQIISEIS